MCYGRGTLRVQIAKLELALLAVCLVTGGTRAVSAQPGAAAPSGAAPTAGVPSTQPAPPPAPAKAAPAAGPSAAAGGVSAPAAVAESSPSAGKSVRFAPHRGGIAIPFIGVQTLQGDSGENMEPGLRLGILGGGYLTPRISLGVEVALDWMNPGAPLDRGDYVHFMGSASVSPLYHLPLAQGAAEFVFGPKLGIWYTYQYMRAPAVFGTTFPSVTGTGYGPVLGLNAGFFLPVSAKTATGFVISYEFRDISESCATTNDFKVCSDRGDGFHVLSFHAALMF